jgi:hypothetical protein
MPAAIRGRESGRVGLELQVEEMGLPEVPPGITGLILKGVVTWGDYSPLSLPLGAIEALVSGMNTIQPSFTERGFNHREIERKGEWRLFERRGQGKAHWEVVRIRIAQPFTVRGVEYPLREVYPNSEAWGIDGFTYTVLDSARRKLETVAE